MEFKPVPNRPEYIWEISAIFSFFEDVDEIMATQIDASNGDVIANRITDLLMRYPSSNDVCAAAAWYREAAYRMEYDNVVKALKNKEITEELKGITSASILKNYIDSRVAEFTHLKVKAERTNAAITHTLDALRSLLSKAKADREISRHAQNV